MKNIKLLIATIVIYCMTNAPMIAQEQLENNTQKLYRRCSKFPFNSKCTGSKPSISPEKLESLEAECILEQKGLSKCKITILNDHVTIVTEFGEKLLILNEQRDTQEITFPSTAIESLYYSESNHPNIAAIVASGLLGLFANKDISALSIQYQSDLELEEKNIFKSIVIVTNRDHGKQIRSQLESITGLKAEAPYNN